MTFLLIAKLCSIQIDWQIINGVIFIIYLQESGNIYVKNENYINRFVEAVLWMSSRNAVYRRFSDLTEKRMSLVKMLYYFTDNPDMK